MSIRDRSEIRRISREKPPPGPEERYVRVAGPGRGAPLILYRATANASGGQITVKVVDSDGVVSGDNITLEVLP